LAQDGYSLISTGLPALRAYIVEPFVDVDQLTLAGPVDDRDVDRYLKEVAGIKLALAVRGMTIGPKAPPTDPNTASFVKTIAGYNHAAAAMGWLTSALADQVDGLLSHAYDSLTVKDSATARDLLTDLLVLVNAHQVEMSSEAEGELSASLRSRQFGS